MARGRSLVWLPLVLLWQLVKAMVVPVALAVLAWWLLPQSWAYAVTTAAVVYLAGIAVLAGAQLRGRVRSMARGTYTIRDDSRRRGR